MLVVTTSVLQGKQITEYHGLVSGEAILGANIFKDFFAGIRDIVGGRSASYENELRKAKELAIQEMCEAAEQMVRALPAGELSEIPRATHPAHLDNPEAFREAVTGFLARHGFL